MGGWNRDLLAYFNETYEWTLDLSVFIHLVGGNTYVESTVTFFNSSFNKVVLFTYCHPDVLLCAANHCKA